MSIQTCAVTSSGCFTVCLVIARASEQKTRIMALRQKQTDGQADWETGKNRDIYATAETNREIQTNRRTGNRYARTLSDRQRQKCRDIAMTSCSAEALPQYLLIRRLIGWTN